MNDILPIPTDIDECEDGTFICDPNAFCTNTVGCYTCTCQFGYSGDGENCVGRSISMHASTTLP